MKFFKSLKNQATSFLDQYKTQNPATFAAAQQAVGGLLIADGLVGLENPLDGQNKRPGIFGALVAIGFGILFTFIPTIGDKITGSSKMTATTSAIVESIGRSSTSNTDDSNSCSMSVKYTVDGQEYTKQSSISSSSYCGLNEGQAININYDPANPANWVYDLKTLNLIFKIFFWVGVFIIVSSIFTFFVRLLSIIFGWKLLREGRKNAAGLPPGTDINTLIAEIKKNFASSVFNFGSPPSQVQASSTTTPPTPPPPNK